MTPDTALVVVRAFIYTDLLILFGLSLFAGYGLTRPEEAIRALRLRGWTVLLAASGFVLSLLHIAAMAAVMTGSGLLDVEGDAVLALISADGMGNAWLIRMVVLVVMLPAAVFLPTRPTFALFGTIGCSAIALATLAWAGHGAMNSGALGWAHLAADLLHLLAAGGWIGALVAMLMLLFDRGAVTDRVHVARLDRALGEFSSMGSVLVATILVTGIVNVASVVGWVPIGRLLGSAYGQLLAAKVALFMLMLALAATNRFYLSPALSRARCTPDAGVALRGLRLSIGLEMLMALTVLVIVAVLGMRAPPS